MEENTLNLFDFQEAINTTFTQFSQQVITYFPQIIGSLLLLLLGWVIAHALSLSAMKIVQGLDKLLKRFMKLDAGSSERIKRSYALISSRVVFWVVMLFFVAVSANVLGWEMFSGWMDSVVSYLPGLISGLMIILAGFLVANLGRSAVMTAAHRSGIAQSMVIARAVQIVILFSAVIIGVEQIGLNVDFLSNIIVLIVGVLLAGIVLAFSLGAKTMVENIIGAQFTRKHCRIGDNIMIKDVEGEILELTQVALVVETKRGRAVVPAAHLQKEVSFITSYLESDETLNKGGDANV